MKGMNIPIQPGVVVRGRIQTVDGRPAMAGHPAFLTCVEPETMCYRQPAGSPVRPRSSTMQLTRLFAAVTALGLAGVCSASDKWDAKDPSSWSQETIHKLMHDSPWAHAGKVSLESSPGGMNRGGGQYPNGRNDPNGGNYPSDPNDPNNRNGGGYPGGGNSRRSGVYLPGGIGLPFPGGGGSGLPGGRGRGRGGNRREGPVTSSAIVRWDSALPLRQAFALQDPDAHASAAEAVKTPGWHKADEAPAAATSAASAKAAEALSPSQTPTEYIIAVDGFPLTSAGDGYARQRQGSDTSQKSGRPADQDDDKSNSQYGGRDPEVIREELMERTTISRGTGRSLRPVKVEFDLPGKTGIIYFHFSREDEITLKDKELDFQTQLGGDRLERKFETKEMVYKGKLEL